MQFMGLASKGSQLRGGLRTSGRLAEQSLAKYQRLICTYYKSIGVFRGHEQGLVSRQQGCDFSGRRQRGGKLNRSLVELGGNCLESNTGIGEKRLPRSALRRQDQRFRSAPDRHSASRWR
jgi:hypothetical protein